MGGKEMKFNEDNVTDILEMKETLWRTRNTLMHCSDKIADCIARVGDSERLALADYKLDEAISAMQRARFYMSEELDLLLKEANNDNSRDGQQD
jgi:hypothetical protein